MDRARNLALTLAVMVLVTTPAFAHPGHSDGSGFAAGFLHPLSGLDHLLAMIAIGILAGSYGGWALVSIPAAFLALMAAGGAIGMSGIAIPGVDWAIALSVLVFGGLITSWTKFSSSVVAALAGTFAIFHGAAHGTELPATMDPLAFGTGFMVATTFLIAVGVSLCHMSVRLAAHDNKLRKLGGGATALSGALLLANVAFA